MDRAEFDLTNPAHIAEGDPHAYLKYLRQHAPVSRIINPAGQSYWAVVKYADVTRIYRDPVSFSSEAPVSITDNFFNEAAGVTLLVTDPPRHLKLRAVLKWSFTPRAVAPLEEAMRSLARRIVQEAVAKGEGDFVPEVAGRLPASVICQMLGVPPADRPWVERLAYVEIGAADPEFQQLSAEGGASARAGQTADLQGHARAELARYFDSLIAERRRNPAADLLGKLANGAIDGVPLSDVQTRSNFFLLLTAGLDTTRNALSGGVHALLNNRDQLERLVANPALVRTAVEEFVRWTSPAFHNIRKVTQDTEIRGQKVRAGEFVAMFLASANRDEEVFAEADRFDVGRSPNEHLGFGLGEHFCLGANLARLELRVALQELLPHLRGLELTGPVQRMHHTSVPGLKHMPVRFGASGAG